MTSLNQLRQQYLELTNQVLPQLALQRHFPVRHNHCFQRIILDNLLGRCWYEVLQRGKEPAYRQLTEAQLQEAITPKGETALHRSRAGDRCSTQ